MGKIQTAWPDVALRLLGMSERNGKLFWSIIVVLVICAGAGGYIYLRTHTRMVLAPVIQDNGNNNQNAPVNDGTMNQINK